MDSIRLVVCDDESVVHEQVRELLEAYAKRENICLDIRDCYSGDELVDMSEECDVLLLDIDMPGMNGIQAAERLLAAGRAPHIIMLTAKRERFKEAFRIGARRFVTKPIDADELYEAVGDAVLSLAGTDEIRFKYNGCACSLRQREIDVIEARRDYLRVYAGGREFTTNMSMKELLSVLDGRIFAAVHRSYTVNLLSVSDVHREYLVMKDGTHIPISRRKRDEVMCRVTECDRRHM